MDAIGLPATSKKHSPIADQTVSQQQLHSKSENTNNLLLSALQSRLQDSLTSMTLSNGDNVTV